MKRTDPAEALADELLDGVAYLVQTQSDGVQFAWFCKESILVAIRRHFHPFDRAGYMREYMRKKRAKAKKRKEAMAR